MIYAALIGFVCAVWAGMYAYLLGRAKSRDKAASDALRRVERGLQAGREAERDTRTPEQILRDLDGDWRK